jgi:predicted transcriptional regulator of viral defense system
MRRKYHDSFKTLGPQAARLVTELYERGKLLFTHAEVEDITHLAPGPSRSFANKLIARGVVARLRPGLFTLVPFELGRARTHLGNPYAIAHELAHGKGYYISHASAMDIHGMTTQPQLIIYVTSVRRIRHLTISGVEFRFVHCERKHFFGTTGHWINKYEKVVVSDLARTVLDGLRHPQYCGGITEVSKGFWMRRQDINAGKLVDYALRLGNGAVIRRLGYILETFQMNVPTEIERLRGRLTQTYELLDPLLPREGKFVARWRLRLNVSPDEIKAAVGT